MEITSINAHYKHRHSVWDMPEFPAWARIKGTQLCGDVVDNGTANCCSVQHLDSFVPLVWCQRGEQAGRCAGVCRRALEPVVPVGLCDWRRTGRGSILFGTAQWPCPALGSPEQVPYFGMLRCCSGGFGDLGREMLQVAVWRQ